MQRSLKDFFKPKYVVAEQLTHTATPTAPTAPATSADSIAPTDAPAASDAHVAPATSVTQHIASRREHYAVEAHRLKSCVDQSTETTLDDVAIRCNRAMTTATAMLARDTLIALAEEGKPLLRFWTTSVVAVAFGLATDGYKPMPKSKTTVDRLTAVRDAMPGGVELQPRKGIGQVLTDQSQIYAANALTSLKLHTANRIKRLVHLRAKLPQAQFDALSDDEKKTRKDDVKLACEDAVAPPYDPTRHSELTDLVDSVREFVGIDAWEWYKPGVSCRRRDLLEVVEHDPEPVVRAMHKINLELAAAGANTFAIVPIRSAFVPRFVTVTQSGLSDMGLLDIGGDCNQATLSKRMRRQAEVHNDDSVAVDSEIRAMSNTIKSLDGKIKKTAAESDASLLRRVQRKALATELASLRKERALALCPSKIELKRVRAAHAAEAQAAKQRKIDDALAIRAGTKEKSTKAEKEAAKQEMETRKRDREAELAELQARVDAEDTGAAAAAQAKSGAFEQVLRLPPKLTRSKTRRFADGFKTDGFSVRLGVYKTVGDPTGPSESPTMATTTTTTTTTTSNKRRRSNSTPTDSLPKRGVIGVEEFAAFVGARQGTALKEGLHRDLAPKHQNDRANELLDEAFGGDCPFHVVGCDPGKRELAVLVDPDLFGIHPSTRPNGRVMSTRYTAAQRRHDYTPGCYGLRKKQHADPLKADRVKLASMAATYRAAIATPHDILEAEHSIVADAHTTAAEVPSASSPHLDRFDAWLHARARITPMVRSYYETPLRRKLRWKKHIEHERSVAMFVNRIRAMERSIGGGKQLVIAWGGWGKSAGRPGQACNKRSPPAMGVGLLRKVAETFLVIVVPEGYSTKTCFHCGGKASRCVEIEEARRPKRDERATEALARTLAKIGEDDEVALARAQTRYERAVAFRPHVRGCRCCESCGIRLSRDGNGGANIGLNGKRFLLGIGTFKPLSERQQALASAN